MQGPRVGEVFEAPSDLLNQPIRRRRTLPRSSAGSGPTTPQAGLGSCRPPPRHRRPPAARLRCEGSLIELNAIGPERLRAKSFQRCQRDRGRREALDTIDRRARLLSSRLPAASPMSARFRRSSASWPSAKCPENEHRQPDAEILQTREASSRFRPAISLLAVHHDRPGIERMAAASAVIQGGINDPAVPRGGAKQTPCAVSASRPNRQVFAMPFDRAQR